MKNNVFENPDSSVFAGSLESPPTVLLVENDRNGRRLLSEILVRLGFKVIAACDAPEAVKQSAESPIPIDVLLTDLVLHPNNGVEVSKRVREHHPGVKVIFISGFTEFAARQFGFDLDGPLLEKPICVSALKSMIADVVQPSRSLA